MRAVWPKIFRLAERQGRAIHRAPAARNTFAMMILRSASPFARKVRIAISLLGLSSKIELAPVNLDDAADSIRTQNPIGKIPVLVLEDGSGLYDSPVIVEYLDHVAGGGKVIPKDAPARFDVLRLQALCDGILDACLALVYESRYRPADKFVQSWADRQNDKVTRGLKALEASPPAITALPDVGQISVACVLGYLDLRFEGKWRKDYPKLVQWHDDFAAKFPVFEATKVKA
jgi:glutathione S-transferase